MFKFIQFALDLIYPSRKPNIKYKNIKNIKIVWSTSFKYLGISIKSGSMFSVDCKPGRGAFYRSFNSIFYKIPKANEFEILSLVETYCMPLVLYTTALNSFVSTIVL